MARRFNGLQFAPMHLRPVLRGRMERGEHLIAWGVATAQDDRASMHLLAHFLPGVGPLFAAAAVASSKRLVIVTSRRVIVVLNKHPRKIRRDLAVCFEAAHEYLAIKRRSRRLPRFEFSVPGQEPPVRVSLDRSKSAGARRLAEALGTLASDPPIGPASGARRP